MASASPAASPEHSDAPLILVENKGLLVTGVMLASLIQVLDATIANVALPHMQTALGAGADTINWVLTSYILGSAVAMPITGWLADRIGSRKLFIASVFGFILASILCGMAQNLTEMVIFRTLQGVAGAFIGPLGQAAILDTTRPSKIGQMMAIWGAGVVIGPIIGPVLGGYLTENWNWRWVFYVNVPLGAIALFLLLAQLPSRPIRHRPFDLTGFAMVGLALSSIQLLLDRGPHVDWFNGLETWIYLAVAISTIWMSVIHFATATHPLFDRAIFKDVNLVIALIFMTIAGYVMFASMALLPPMLQGIFGYDAIDTGLMLMTRGTGVLVSMQLASQMMRKGLDTRILVGAGFVITAYSLHMMSKWSLTLGSGEVSIAGLVQGLGIGLVFIPLNTLAFATIAPHLRTDASSLMNLSRTIGSSIGIAIMSYLLTRNMQISHADLASQMNQSFGSVVNLGTIDRYQELSDVVMGMINGEVTRQSAMIAYLDDFYLMMWMTLAALPLTLFMRPAKPRG